MTMVLVRFPGGQFSERDGELDAFEHAAIPVVGEARRALDESTVLLRLAG